MFFVILLPPHMEDCGGREAQIWKSINGGPFRLQYISEADLPIDLQLFDDN